MSKTTASPLDAHLGYWLRFVSNHVSHAFRLKVEARGVTLAEWVVLRVLFDGSASNPSQVAEKLGMTRGAISKIVDRLAAKRLVRCTVDARDRRFQSVTLTVAGRKLVPALAALADRNDTEFFGHLPAHQQTALRDVLQDIVRRRELRDVPID